MDFMPIGTAKFANAGDIFSSLRMKHILDELKERYDLILIDAPPVSTAPITPTVAPMSAPLVALLVCSSRV